MRQHEISKDILGAAYSKKPPRGRRENPVLREGFPAGRLHARRLLPRLKGEGK
ncbi:hypothetical protein MTY_2550 [Moorella thermoacetica Y72]|uniref:Uncharacterized protein n=1 Tax=Moorella thermoacetica Y72 TaxID=1325331 RepID=A0A0S6UHZ7_NEOTH|nr:hypothetical protein MTY_2550 [Moorella thermoacetica Y72]